MGCVAEVWVGRVLSVHIAGLFLGMHSRGGLLLVWDVSFWTQLGVGFFTSTADT